jgi:hypothetical protein
LRVGPKAECSVEEPHGELVEVVLPITTAPAAARRCDHGASYGGRQPSRMPDEHVVGTPRVHRLSLSATGTPASGPGSSPAATRSSTLPPTPVRVGHDGGEGGDLAVAGGDGREVGLDHVDRRALPGADGGGDGGGRAGALTPPPRGGRDPEAVVLDGGRRRQHLGPVEARADHVVAQHVDERERVGRRGHALGVERLDVLGVVEHAASWTVNRSSSSSLRRGGPAGRRARRRHG